MLLFGFFLVVPKRHLLQKARHLKIRQCCLDPEEQYRTMLQGLSFIRSYKHGCQHQERGDVTANLISALRNFKDSSHVYVGRFAETQYGVRPQPLAFAYDGCPPIEKTVNPAGVAGESTLVCGFC